MVFHFDLQVRGYELDAFGHVNNAVYLHYLEEARWDFLRRTGMLDGMAARGHLLAVVDLSIRYVRECRLGDELRVETELLPGSLFATFRQDVRRLASGRRAVQAVVKTLLLDRDRAPLDFPDGIRRRFAAPRPRPHR